MAAASTVRSLALYQASGRIKGICRFQRAFSTGCASKRQLVTATILPRPAAHPSTTEPAKREASTSRRLSASAWVPTPYPSSADSPLAHSPIPIVTTVKEYRTWRLEATKAEKSVGFVATMGALHQGHLELVKASLEENDQTVISIFVNPAQFAPTEDLASYPRTIESDIEKLASLRSRSGNRRVDIAFVPSVREMYPNGFTQVVADQIGAFVEVKGLSHQMEGGSRPTFFRGVATVVTKLFHIIQPDRTYFGQKDIQQCIVLRRLLSDLLFSHPPSPEHLRVIATRRDPVDQLALSSRNAYLSVEGRKVAPTLYKALKAGQNTWLDRRWDSDKSSDTEERIRQTLANARRVILDVAEKCHKEGKVNLKLDYISLNHPHTLENLEEILASKGAKAIDVSEGAILSGAALVSDKPDGKITRLIDNLLLGFQL